MKNVSTDVYMHVPMYTIMKGHHKQYEPLPYLPQLRRRGQRVKALFVLMAEPITVL